MPPGIGYSDNRRAPWMPQLPQSGQQGTPPLPDAGLPKLPLPGSPEDLALRRALGLGPPLPPALQRESPAGVAPPGPPMPDASAITPAMAKAPMPGAAPAQKPVTGEEMMLADPAFLKGPGAHLGPGPWSAAPPMAKGQSAYPPGPGPWNAGGAAVPPGYLPEVWNGPHRWGEAPSLNQFMAARVPMLPPAYADVDMEHQNAALLGQARGDAMREWSQAAQGFGRLDLDRTSQAADWALRRDLGMGGLGLQQRQLGITEQNAAFDRMMREKTFGADERKQSFEERKHAESRDVEQIARSAYAAAIAGGKTDAEAAAIYDSIKEKFSQSQPPSGQVPPFPGTPPPADSPGIAKGAPPFTPGWTPPGGSPPVGKGNVYDRIKGEMDRFFLKDTTKPPLPENRNDIGEALATLNNAKQPGFVRANKDAVIAYLKAVYGQDEFEKAMQAPPPQAQNFMTALWDQVIPGGVLLRGSAIPAGQSLGRQFLGKTYDNYYPSWSVLPTDLSQEPWYSHIPFVGPIVRAGYAQPGAAGWGRSAMRNLMLEAMENPPR